MRLSKRSVEKTLPTIHKQVAAIEKDFGGDLNRFWDQLTVAAYLGSIRVEHATAATMASCYLDDTFFDIGRNSPMSDRENDYAAARILESYESVCTRAARLCRRKRNARNCANGSV